MHWFYHSTGNFIREKNSIAEDMFKQSQHNIQGMQQNYEAL